MFKVQEFKVTLPVPAASKLALSFIKGFNRSAPFKALQTKVGFKRPKFQAFQSFLLFHRCSQREQAFNEMCDRRRCLAAAIDK